MTTELMITLLNKANTGTELLAVLDAIADDSNADISGGYVDAVQDEEFVITGSHRVVGATLATVPTLEEIVF